MIEAQVDHVGDARQTMRAGGPGPDPREFDERAYALGAAATA